MMRLVTIFILALLFFVHKWSISQDIYEYAFRRDVIIKEDIKSVKVISPFDDQLEYEEMRFDRLGNNVETILYNSHSTDTSYFISVFSDTLILKEFLVKTEKPDDTTLVATYSYNQAGQLECKNEFYLNKENDLSQEIRYKYDSLGKVIEVLINDSEHEIIIDYVYDNKKRLKHMNQSYPRIVSQINFVYDENKVVQTSILREDNSEYNIVTSTYDDRNHLIATKREVVNQHELEFRYFYEDELLKEIVHDDESITRIEYEYW